MIRLCYRTLAAAATLSTFAALVPPAASLAGPASARISLDVRDLDLYDAVRLLATQADVNVVVDSSVAHHPVTLRLQGVRFDEALATLAQTNDLESVRVGNVTYLGPADVMNRRYPGREGSVRTRVFPLRSAVPQDVAHGLDGILPHGTVIVPDARTSSVVVTATPATLDRARDLIRALDAPNSVQSASFSMRFAKAADVVHTLQSSLAIVPPSSAYASDDQNAVVLAGPADFLAQAGALIARLDRPGRQVRYDVEVTDINPLNDTGNVGFLYRGLSVGGSGGTPQIGSTVLTFPVKTLSVDATLNALVTQGRAQVLARPNISTMNNVPASLLVGEQYPIVYFDARTGTQQVQFVNIGVNLNVTPTIGDDGEVVTDLETDYSQIIGTAAGGFPRIGTRKAQSRLRVRDGETIVIAGLFSDVDSSTITKVPFLGDVPILGEFFKNRQYAHSKDEVIFLLTPHIVTSENQNSRLLPELK